MSRSEAPSPSVSAVRDPADAPRTVHAPADRRTRLAASADDFARLALGTIVALIASIGFLFWRTSWGAVDATAVDTAIAAAILLTPAPTWLSWMLAAALEDRATPGQHRRGLSVRFARAERSGVRLLRFAIHPLSAPGWLWLAAIAYLLGIALLDWLFLLLAAAVLLSGLGSIVLLALGRRPLHDLLLRSEVEASG